MTALVCLGEITCRDISDIKVFTNYKEGLKYAVEHQKKILLVFDFWHNPTMSTERMLNDKSVISLLQNYTVIFLKTDNMDPEGKSNRKLQHTKFGTTTQPMYYIIDSEQNIIRSHQGYCKKEEFQDFIR